MQINHTHANSVAPSRFPWFLSVAIAVFVGGASIILALYSLYLESQVRTLNSEITTVNNNIALASVDRKIVITQILQTNAIRPTLDIGGLITQFKGVADRANVRLKGFSVANDMISTTLIATHGDLQIHPDPVSTIIRMMRDYSLVQKYFSLEPIYSISGNRSERTTSIQLKVIGKKY